MAIRVDPENNEFHALHETVNFHGQNVLEIGCGGGRVTWHYADMGSHVIAIDPSASQITLAREGTPPGLRARVEFREIGFEAFALASAPSAFDIAILSHSL